MFYKQFKEIDPNFSQYIGKSPRLGKYLSYLEESLLQLMRKDDSINFSKSSNLDTLNDKEARLRISSYSFKPSIIIRNNQEFFS